MTQTGNAMTVVVASQYRDYKRPRQEYSLAMFVNVSMAKPKYKHSSCLLYECIPSYIMDMSAPIQCE